MFMRLLAFFLSLAAVTRTLDNNTFLSVFAIENKIAFYVSDS